MNLSDIIHISIILAGLLLVSAESNAQMVRFVVNVDKSQLSENGSSLFIDRAEFKQEPGVTESMYEQSSSRCLMVASKENIMVLIRTSMSSDANGSEQPVESRYINNGGGCPDNANRLLEVSNSFKGGEAAFHLDQLQIPKRSIPGVKKEIVSYLALPGFRKRGVWMGEGNVHQSSTDTGVEIIIEIEFL